MMTRRISAAFFLALVAAALFSLPASLGFDNESQTGDGERLPDCGFCHTPDDRAQRLGLELLAPSDIKVGDPFDLTVIVDPANISSDEGNLGIFVIDAPTHEFPGDHGWVVVGDPNDNPTPFNYNRLDGVTGKTTVTFRLQEASGELGARTLGVWVKYDNGGAWYVEDQIVVNVRHSLLADIEVPNEGFFHIYEDVDFSAFSAMNEVESYNWDFDDTVDVDGNGNFTDDSEDVGTTNVDHKYAQDGQVNVTLTVTNATDTAIGRRTLTIRNYALYIEGPLKGNCFTCHDKAGQLEVLNSFGLDFQAAETHRTEPTATIASLALLDSDGDEFTNQVELEGGTLPGDPESFPTDIQWTLPVPTVFVIGQEIVFQASGPDDHPYRWAFGDGNNATGKEASHIYPNPGFYIVTLNYNLTNIKRELRIIDPTELFPAPLNVCNTCHINPDGTGGYNVYGANYVAQYGVHFDPWGARDAINSWDSDGDGVSNAVEIEAGHFPGDPASVPLPDLQVARIWVAPALPEEGQEVTLYASVVNLGYFDALNASVTIRLDGDTVFELSGLTLFSGVPAIIPLTWEAQGVKIHNLSVVVDEGDGVAETDETNNQGVFVFTVVEEATEEGVPGLDLVLVLLVVGLLAIARRRGP